MTAVRLTKTFVVAALSASVTSFASLPARADGMFMQFDASRTTATTVFSVETGNLSYATSFTDFGVGSDLNASVTYKFVVGETAPVTFRIGPAVQYERLTTGKFGVRAVAEHYRGTSFGHVFLLGEFNTIDKAYFGLATVGFNEPDLDFEFTVAGDDDGYRDQSLAVTYGVPETKARLRAGYRFQSREIFAGISINTF